MADNHTSDTTRSSPLTPLARLDAWMADHPWHPRIIPFVVYLSFLALILPARDWHPLTYPLLYSLQCGLVLYLLWRYRRLLPELTLSFHWLAVPVGVGVCVAWVVIGKWMVSLAPNDLGDPGYDFFEKMNPTLAWTSVSLRLLGMSIVVPMFEELFIRSLCLRSFHRFRRTGVGVLHLLMDLPLLGEWLIHTNWGKRAGRHPPVFGPVFEKTPLGALSLFGVAASTFVFMMSHANRDKPAAIVCGVAYCLLLWATRKKGLGPVIWAHGITNALLWAYTLAYADWRFL